MTNRASFRAKNYTCQISGVGCGFSDKGLSIGNKRKFWICRICSTSNAEIKTESCLGIDNCGVFGCDNNSFCCMNVVFKLSFEPSLYHNGSLMKCLNCTLCVLMLLLLSLSNGLNEIPVAFTFLFRRFAVRQRLLERCRNNFWMTPFW